MTLNTARPLTHKDVSRLTQAFGGNANNTKINTPFKAA